MYNGKSVPIVYYDKFINKAERQPKNVRGRVFMPSGHTSELQAAVHCVVINEGLRRSKVDRDYHDNARNPHAEIYSNTINRQRVGKLVVRKRSACRDRRGANQ